MRRSKFGLLPFGIAAWFIAMLMFGFYAFNTCYTEHRNDLGVSVITALLSCSG